MKTVYCNNCKHKLFAKGNGGEYLCKVGSIKDYMGNKGYTLCSYKNSGLDCEDFKPKLFYSLRRIK